MQEVRVIANIMNILNGGGGNAVNASCPTIYVDGDAKLQAELLRDEIIKIITFNKVKGKDDKEH